MNSNSSKHIEDWIKQKGIDSESEIAASLRNKSRCCISVSEDTFNFFMNQINPSYLSKNNTHNSNINSQIEQPEKFSFDKDKQIRSVNFKKEVDVKIYDNNQNISRNFSSRENLLNYDEALIYVRSRAPDLSASKLVARAEEVEIGKEFFYKQKTLEAYIRRGRRTGSYKPDNFFGR